MARYIYDRPDWPHFRWDDAALAKTLGETRHRQGRLIGRMETLGVDLQNDANLRTLTEDALKSSAIEGERLDDEEVRSSFARRLGMEIESAVASGRNADGLAEMFVDVAEGHARPLTEARLHQWHRWLFPDAGGRRRPIAVGAWRTDEHAAMRVVSGWSHREKVHFEAPAASRVPGEMARFLASFEDGSKTVDPLIEAAIAHIWFVTIHPFDDGNGRIGRAVADLALARSERVGRRFYSVSAILRNERPAYYAGLEATQKGDLDLTERLLWFLDIVGKAIDRADATLSGALRTARFWRSASALALNERQRRMLTLLLDDSLIGPLTTDKWRKMTKVSQDTALRDVTDLVAKGLLIRGSEGGRSTRYVLAGAAAEAAGET